MLGSASALAFSRGGASLALMDIQEDKLSAIRRKLVETNHPNDKVSHRLFDISCECMCEIFLCSSSGFALDLHWIWSPRPT